MRLPLPPQRLAPDLPQHILQVPLETTPPGKQPHKVHHRTVPFRRDELILRIPVHRHQLGLKLARVHRPLVEGQTRSLQEAWQQRHLPRADGPRERVPHEREAEEGREVPHGFGADHEPECLWVIARLGLAVPALAQRLVEEVVERGPASLRHVKEDEAELLGHRTVPRKLRLGRRQPVRGTQRRQRPHKVQRLWTDRTSHRMALTAIQGVAARRHARHRFHNICPLHPTMVSQTDGCRGVFVPELSIVPVEPKQRKVFLVPLVQLLRHRALDHPLRFLRRLFSTPVP
mmetsp:Transcript_16597/g.39725  ORF Transcript_16597/g.39725 Transcript_16597/m.39725 type:complete len:288 (-) Transcript_16597:13-876(-)